MKRIFLVLIALLFSATMAFAQHPGTWGGSGTGTSVDPGGTGIAYCTYSGGCTWSAVAVSANVLSFLGSANYATARTNLGLAIGTNVQAQNTNLAAFAALTPTANSIAGYNASTVLGLYTNFASDDSAYQFYNASTNTKKLRFDLQYMTAAKTLTVQPTVADNYSYKYTITGNTDIVIPTAGTLTTVDALNLKAPSISPAFTTPDLGAATGASLVISGAVDVGGILSGKIGSANPTADYVVGSNSAKELRGYIFYATSTGSQTLTFPLTAATGNNVVGYNYLAGTFNISPGSNKIHYGQTLYNATSYLQTTVKGDKAVFHYGADSIWFVIGASGSWVVK